jgi:hypothetical protein
VVTQAQILGPDCEPLDHTETGKTFAIKVNFTTNQELLGPNLRIAFQHETGPLVTMVSNHRVHADFGTLPANEYAVTTKILDNPLLPGRYRVHIDVFDYTGTRTLDTWNEVLEFPVRSASGEIGQGFVTIPATFEITAQ